MRQGLDIYERLILPLVYDSDATAQHKNKRKNSAYLLRLALRIFILKRQKKASYRTQNTRNYWMLVQLIDNLFLLDLNINP